MNHGASRRTLWAAVAFLAVGIAKSKVVEQDWWRGGLETLALGGSAAALAYLVGLALSGIA